MLSPVPTRTLALLAVLGSLSLPLAACGSSDPSDPQAGPSSLTAPPVSDPPLPMTPAPSQAATPEPTAPGSATASAGSAGAAGATFGPGCSKVPTSGKGSFDGTSTDGVATAAGNNPLLSTLVVAVKRAGLVDTLNNTEDVTVFAPDDDAFAALGKTTLTKVLADRSQLTTILTTHVVEGRLAPADLAGTHKTLSGSSITVTGSGEDFTVNGNARVVCGNVQTANATVYVIDHVLMTR
ncbi:Uncaracterized surface protein containing fasciclin (FAS1) repeats [Microlunatus sagamiharensis]|uniref:Uncaracterized surface protein containing fasciclin (FAS1) repeats n=1 Tax=Microlunatus sagamiharensis TaxID=546874 RepID=A0A1H2LR57_9ACTN|nr:fasciclin domain-containing protein [Microlunatus sagamiharensis]SDU83344.1 Uncaracterized surface protein containing fasciclin (FAS1) repeats [Microlunatus sagamiharensis]